MSSLLQVTPRCDHCDWWWPFGSNKGECRLFTLTAHQKVHTEARLEVQATHSGEATCTTDADFGCVQWKSNGGKAFLVACPIHAKDCPLRSVEEGSKEELAVKDALNAKDALNTKEPSEE